VTLHVHLDPIGGIAGDMFAAALLDAFPLLETALASDLDAAGLFAHVRIAHARDASQGVVARGFRVEHANETPRPTRHYREIRDFVQRSGLDPRVRDRATAIFDLLANAEAAVHGVARDEVHFHELADWDSITDIVAAASLIERSGVHSWTCGSVPSGQGLVHTAHGRLPLPAPAAALLLQGFRTHVDEHPGERTTPTGAAILRHLMADNGMRRPDGVLVRSGMGCGMRRLEGMPNVLRATVLEAQPVQGVGPPGERIGVLAFEIDDMTPEELGVAIERLRNCRGVLDASYQMRFGKKGRTQFAVQVLCAPEATEAVTLACFAETSTLGVRVDMASRRVLRRTTGTLLAQGKQWAVKRAYRPDGSVTAKLESDELATLPGLHRRRAVAAAADSAIGAADDTAPDAAPPRPVDSDD